MTPQEVLLKTAEQIERRGWCQHHYVDFDGRCCAVGAMNWTGASAKEKEAAYFLLGKHIGFTVISTWNDEPGRTEEEVLAVLRDAGSREFA